ncbi:MAG: hypothetical protein HY537_05645 [Deltaproteobacteria bacterium]|nr:hypothetical protein [Deltaproteobacteria bacterium]
MDTKILTNERDLKIFKFLWRWKLGTTKTLAERFFPGLNPVIAYNRLTALKKAGLVEIRTLDSVGNRFVWTLTQKSFRMLKNHLPELKDEGFRSENIEHDFFATAIHLGEWLVDKPHGVDFFSEQQLRRYKMDHYPDWVPHTELHRPDGYWLVPYKNKEIVVALEVELTPKAIANYEVVANFYKDNPKVIRIVWVVRTLAIIKYIESKIRKEVKDEALKHNFIQLSDFIKLVWHSPVLFGYEQGKTLGYVLGSHPTKQDTLKMNRPLIPMASSLLDTRKCPFPSRTYAKSKKTHFIDRMACRPSEQVLQTNHIEATLNVSINPPPITSIYQPLNNHLSNK